MSEATYPCYWQKEDSRGYWFWVFYSKKGNEIARSSKSYETRADCEFTINLLQNSSKVPIFFEKDA
ncbi:MAG: DUF1508 domain-containing protein [Methylophilaceae bacterium]|uniref:DUF1508 domain-containing protein n=1 Tax=Methylovorus sp. MM2 TaxID=1848038 RepID=UPI001041EFF5